MQERTARIERAEGDEPGRFSMILATEGEASDGDILSIKGGKIPARMPLLLSHWNDPTATAGSVVEPHKELGSSPPRLRAIGEIEMEGEGPLADIRRDVAFMIGKGHVGAVSIRWDEIDGGKPPVRRVNLPSDHPHFVNAETEASWRKRSGYYWPEWRALEGSIVALGADTEALIGRSLETEGRVRDFWHAMADNVSSDGEADVKAALVALGLHSNECRELGASTADRINAVAVDALEGEPLEAVEFAGWRFVLPAKAVAEIRKLEGVMTDDIRFEIDNARAAIADRQDKPARNEPEPDRAPATDPSADLLSVLRFEAGDVTGPANVEALGQLLSEMLDKHDENIKRYVQELLDLRTGKVSP